MKVELLSVPGCGACVTLGKLLDRLAVEWPGFSHQEVDLSVHPEVASDYGVMGCPALAIEGVVVTTGALGAKRLRKLLIAHGAGPGSQEDLVRLP